LAVLSAISHGRDANVKRALDIAMAAHKASAGLDADRCRIYSDLIHDSLGKAARNALKNMDPRTYKFKSEFALHYIALGCSKGHASLITKQLTCRFGRLSARTKARVQRASISDLEAIGKRLLTAATLREALGPE
jgi:Domain of unknown function (DUF4351)